MLARRGTGNPRWKGGRYVQPHGYVQVSFDGRQVYEHRVVMERMLGRPLESWEHVHHRNGDRADNRPENLEITAQAAHNRRHLALNGRWSLNADCCVVCGTTTRRHERRGMCSRCYQRDRRGDTTPPNEDARGRNGRWSRAFDCCVDCGSTTQAHEAHGRCLPCDKMWRRRRVR